ERERAVVGDAGRHHGELVAARDEPARLLARFELDPTHVRRPVVRRREDAHVPSQLPRGSSGAAVRMPRTPIEKLPRIVCEPSTKPRIAGVITRTFSVGFNGP